MLRHACESLQAATRGLSAHVIPSRAGVVARPRFANSAASAHAAAAFGTVGSAATPPAGIAHDSAPPCRPMLACAGGGIYFFWQAGAMRAIRESGLVNLEACQFSGASAGSLVATLAACSVPTDAAVRLALEIADEAELWTRSAGLAFVWGRLVERWLTQLLPDECGAMVSGRLSLCTLALRPRELDSTRMHITRFESKADIVHAALASVHVPWFMDGNATKLYRGHRCIDGSILAPRDVMIERAAAAAAAGDSSGTATRQRPLILPTTTTLLIDHHCDARIKARRKLVDSFEMVSRARVLEMVEMGHEYARARLERGDDREWNAFRRAVELSSASVPSAVPCSAHTSAANAVKP